MPDPKDNQKATGDTHDPDLDTGAGQENPRAQDRQGLTPRGGQIKDKEADTSDSYGDTRDTGGHEQ